MRRRDTAPGYRERCRGSRPMDDARGENQEKMIPTIYAYVCAAEAVVARAFLMVMAVLLFGSCIARVFGHPINWAIDVATCIFAWACFFSADIAWRKNKLMSVEVFTNRLSPRAQRMCRLLNYGVLVLFLIYLIPTGLWLSYISRARSFQGIPEFSYSWVTMSLPVGAVLLLITTLLKLHDEIRGSAANT